jgi:muconolactone delta-isomerase
MTLLSEVYRLRAKEAEGKRKKAATLKLKAAWRRAAKVWQEMADKEKRLGR